MQQLVWHDMWCAPNSFENNKQVVADVRFSNVDKFSNVFKSSNGRP